MSRQVVSVDLAVLAWIIRSPDAEALLEHVETHFAKSSGRLGYMLKGDALSGYSGGCDDLEHLVLMRDGLLTGVLQIRNDTPVLHWERGILSIWRGAEILPRTVTNTLEGRRLQEVVVHALLPDDAVVVSVSDDGLWLRMTCTGYTETIIHARRRVRQAGVDA